MTKSKKDLLNGDAVSMQPQEGQASGSASRRYTDEDVDDDAQLLIDDLPPLYSEIGTDGGQVADEEAGVGIGTGIDNDGEVPLLGRGGEFVYESFGGPGQPVRNVFCAAADRNPETLMRLLLWHARRPPRPFVQLRGTHSQTVERDGKRETRQVTDFDVKVELTPYLYSDARRQKGWRVLTTAQPYERVRRGTVFRCQDPAWKDGGAVGAGVGVGAPSGTEPAEAEAQLLAWCEAYCADPSPLRRFSLQRQMLGFDSAAVREQLVQLVRRANYRGNLSVTFPVDEARVDVYSDHRLNRWRLVRWIRVLCVLTLTILFTWPFLFFRTKRYEVASVSWYFSKPDSTVPGGKKYIAISEDQWFNLWGRAIQKAVLNKRQGVLDQEDLRAAEGEEVAFRSGNESVDDVISLFQAGISAVNHVNRQFGWGGDT